MAQKCGLALEAGDEQPCLRGDQLCLCNSRGRLRLFDGASEVLLLQVTLLVGQSDLRLLLKRGASVR